MMNQQATLEGSDSLLWPFLRASEASAAESLLIDLIQKHADPIIAKILKSKFHVSLNDARGDQENQDAIEIASEFAQT